MKRQFKPAAPHVDHGEGRQPGTESSLDEDHPASREMGVGRDGLRARVTSDMSVGRGGARLAKNRMQTRCGSKQLMDGSMMER
jgi:hypothetical protein